MKFLVDAQLSVVIGNFLREKGFDAVHTSWLPGKNSTTDEEICRLSLAEKRIVITKDSDFYHSLLLKGEPYKLLFITTGNISIKDLKLLFHNNLEFILKELEKNRLVEFNQKEVKSIY
ncbi:MAG: DUF5615 family PIN-like protein [Cytophagales bacterium]|nr:DUF5615 family PIN-like protein [Cytophagales bacterium]